jgi:addiction module HigA family antidote
MITTLPKDGMRPVHPGEMLREEFLVPLGISANQLAQAMGVPANRVSGILNEKRALTADTALRLGKVFGMSAEFWMNLQKNFELRTAEIEAERTRAYRGVRKLSRRFWVASKESADASERSRRIVRTKPVGAVGTDKARHLTLGRTGKIIERQGDTRRAR